MHEAMEQLCENYFKCHLLVTVITSVLMFTMWGTTVAIGPLLLSLPIAPTTSTSMMWISTLRTNTNVRPVSLFAAFRIQLLLLPLTLTDDIGQKKVVLLQKIKLKNSMNEKMYDLSQTEKHQVKLAEHVTEKNVCLTDGIQIRHELPDGLEISHPA